MAVTRIELELGQASNNGSYALTGVQDGDLVIVAIMGGKDSGGIPTTGGSGGDGPTFSATTFRNTAKAFFALSTGGNGDLAGLSVFARVWDSLAPEQVEFGDATSGGGNGFIVVSYRGTNVTTADTGTRIGVGGSTGTNATTISWATPLTEPTGDTTGNTTQVAFVGESRNSTHTNPAATAWTDLTTNNSNGGNGTISVGEVMERADASGVLNSLTMGGGGGRDWRSVQIAFRADAGGTTAGTPVTATGSYAVTSTGTASTATGSYAVKTAGTPVTATGSYAVTSTGTPTTATGDYAVTSTGAVTATGSYAVTSTGTVATATGAYAVSTTGLAVTATGSYAVLSTGTVATATGSYAVTFTGTPVTATGSYAVTSTGTAVTATGSYDVDSTTSSSVSATGSYAVVSAGTIATATGSYAVTSAGTATTATGAYAVTSTGTVATSTGSYAVTSTGTVTTATGSYAVTAAGTVSTATGSYAVTSTGTAVTATGSYDVDSTTGGSASATGSYAVIAAGTAVTATGAYAILLTGSPVTSTGSYAVTSTGTAITSTGSYAVLTAGSPTTSTGSYAVTSTGTAVTSTGSYAVQVAGSPVTATGSYSVTSSATATATGSYAVDSTAGGSVSATGSYAVTSTGVPAPTVEVVASVSMTAVGSVDQTNDSSITFTPTVSLSPGDQLVMIIGGVGGTMEATTPSPTYDAVYTHSGFDAYVDVTAGGQYVSHDVLSPGAGIWQGTVSWMGVRTVAASGEPTDYEFKAEFQRDAGEDTTSTSATGNIIGGVLLRIRNVGPALTGSTKNWSLVDAFSDRSVSLGTSVSAYNMGDSTNQWSSQNNLALFIAGYNRIYSGYPTPGKQTYQTSHFSDGYYIDLYDEALQGSSTTDADDQVLASAYVSYDLPRNRPTNSSKITTNFNIPSGTLPKANRTIRMSQWEIPAVAGVTATGSYEVSSSASGTASATGSYAVTSTGTAVTATGAYSISSTGTPVTSTGSYAVTSTGTASATGSYAVISTGSPVTATGSYDVSSTTSGTVTATGSYSVTVSGVTTATGSYAVLVVGTPVSATGSYGITGVTFAATPAEVFCQYAVINPEHLGYKAFRQLSTLRQRTK